MTWKKKIVNFCTLDGNSWEFKMCIKSLEKSYRKRTLIFNSVLFPNLPTNRAPPCLLISEDAIIPLEIFWEFLNDAMLSAVGIG